MEILTIPVSSGQVQDVPLNVDPSTIQGIRVENESPLSVHCTWGNVDDQLGAWKYGTYPVLEKQKPPGTVHLESSSLATQTPASPTSSVYILVYLWNDHFPNAGHGSLTRQTAGNNINLTYQSALGAAGASCNASLGGAIQQYTYLVGIQFTTQAPTASTNTELDFTGVGVIPTIYLVEDKDSGCNYFISFPKPVRSSGVNTPIKVTASAGAANRSLLIWGYNA